ncbi:pyridoxamine 5'-phosphate oxidase family protein [Pasteurella oralis]|uniref:Pyridoxamine 5'-phosphate oxidase family protein n=1 Tax=Pasteurella oralis TaxID=1071947 RepID=A0ABW4P008_9PAST|nr:pyridoxamine 5'-phosphate oxidase family protein [Pasteurella oralis]MDO5055017.1 pyridoxamine 5'-phosphate oxidase family protein [Pasteurella oralis]
MQKRLVDFIKKQYAFTLACTENDLPWANGLYYVFDEDLKRLIYVTGEQTHHAKIIMKNPQVAGTIFVPTRFVPSLQGVQFTGKSKQLYGKEAETAFQLYEETYSHQLIRRLSVWEIELEYVRLVDNSLGLFSTIEWKKGQEVEEEDLSLFLK